MSPSTFSVDLQDDMCAASTDRLHASGRETGGGRAYHKIEIRVSQKDYKVQARKGYYAIETGN